VHPPKVETFDVPAMTNTDPKGFVRPVDEYRSEPFGLYLSRPYDEHPKIDWIESWLLPDLSIRVTDWWWREGYERDQDYYIDIVNIDQDGEVWRTEDHYLDIVVCTGRTSTVIDLDEYVEAITDGVLAPDAAERALTSSYRALTGLAASGHDLGAWLSGIGMPLSWKRRR
jgi:predicted RNA-binding protein associated with RNAse of E/G family